MNQIKRLVFLLSVCAPFFAMAKGLYEITFINTTDYAFTYDVDLWADIEKGIGKKMFGGGDREGTIKSLDRKTGKPAVATTKTSYLTNKVIIKTADGKQKMTYKIPRKAGHDLSGKDWVFTIIDDGGVLKVCRKWAHTKVQDEATIAAQVTGIVAGAIIVGVGVGAAAGAVQDAIIITGEWGTIAEGATVPMLGEAQAVTLASDTVIVGVEEGVVVEAALVAPTQAGGVPMIAFIENGAVTALESAASAAQATSNISLISPALVAEGAVIGAAIAAGATAASAAVLGALEIASQKTESAVTSAWEKTKKAFSKAFGLSRKLHKAGCGEFKKVKAKKKK